MRFRVLRQFDWVGERYLKGSIIEIDDSHLRIGGLVRGGTIVYDCGLPRPEDTVGVPIPRELEKATLP